MTLAGKPVPLFLAESAFHEGTAPALVTRRVMERSIAVEGRASPEGVRARADQSLWRVR